jgi:hypothetical protein
VVKSEDVKRLKVPMRKVVANTMFVPKAIGPVLVAIYTAIGARLVLAGKSQARLIFGNDQCFPPFVQRLRSVLRFVNGYLWHLSILPQSD